MDEERPWYATGRLSLHDDNIMGQVVCLPRQATGNMHVGRCIHLMRTTDRLLCTSWD